MESAEQLEDFFRCLSWLDEKAYHGGIYFGLVDGRLGVWYPANCGELGKVAGTGPIATDAIASARNVRDGAKLSQISLSMKWLSARAYWDGVFLGEVNYHLGVWLVDRKCDTPPQAIGDTITGILHSAMLADTARVKKPCEICDAPLDPGKEILVVQKEDEGFGTGYFLEVSCDRCGEIETVAGWGL